MENGWIKLYRKTLENPIFQNRIELLGLWTLILLKTEWSPRKVRFGGKNIELKHGQLLINISELSRDYSVSRSKMHRMLGLLENEKLIGKVSDGRNTVITVLKWVDYQSCEKPNGKVAANQRQTSGKPAENLLIIKEKEEEKNKRIEDDSLASEGLKKPVKNRFGEYQHVLMTNEQLENLFDDYGDSETRDAIKYLDEYIEMSGKKYRNHNLVLRKWVFDAVRDTKKRKKSEECVFNSTQQSKDEQLKILMGDIEEGENERNRSKKVDGSNDGVVFEL